MSCHTKHVIVLESSLGVVFSNDIVKQINFTAYIISSIVVWYLNTCWNKQQQKNIEFFLIHFK